jgi:shikimate kinase
MPKHPHWVVVGSMASGKTTVGERLAEAAGRPFVDNDDALLALTGQRARDLEEAIGVDALHRAEVDALRRMVERPDPAVVAAAAAVVDDPDGRAVLRDAAAVIWLQVPIELLRQRIQEQADDHRPEGAVDALAQLNARRADDYRRLATVVVDGAQSPAEIVEAILPRLRGS